MHACRLGVGTLLHLYPIPILWIAASVAGALVSTKSLLPLVSVLVITLAHWPAQQHAHGHCQIVYLLLCVALALGYHWSPVAFHSCLHGR